MKRTRYEDLTKVGWAAVYLIYIALAISLILIFIGQEKVAVILAVILICLGVVGMAGVLLWPIKEEQERSKKNN